MSRLLDGWRHWRCEPVSDVAARVDGFLHTHQVSARYRSGASLVSRRHAAAIREADHPANATEGYRSYSRLTVGEGDWRLEVRSSDGNLLHEQRFAVQRNNPR